MTNYNDRRRGSVSQFINGLNALPVENEETAFSFNDDNLNLFTDTEFFDFETGTHTDFHAPVTAPPKAGDIDIFGSDLNIDTLNHQNFSATSAHPSGLPLARLAQPPIYPAIPLSQLQQQYQTGPYASQAAISANTNNNGPPGTSGSGISSNNSSSNNNNNNNNNNINSPTSLEDLSRTAGEEDKRKRNTAASARFRVKKKQREQALEKHVKDMADNVKQLEAKVQKLETENTWLKTLVLEKNGGKELLASGTKSESSK